MKVNSTPDMLFLVLGQSNAANTAHVPPYLINSTGVQTFDLTCNAYTVPYTHMPDADGPYSAIWPQVGSMLARETSKTIGFINIARGGTADYQWLPGTVLYENIVNAFISAPQPFTAVLWHQGESDNEQGTEADEYYIDLARIIIRTRTLQPDIQWIIARATMIDGKISNQIRAAQEMVVETFKNCWMGPDTDLLGPEYRYDGTHFNQAGYWAHAESWVEPIKRLI